MSRSCYGATTGKSCDKSSSLASINTLSFWNSRFTKSLLASFQFLSGLGTSLLPSCVKNVVIGNGRTWFLHSKWRLLTHHIRKFLQMRPGPFPKFLLGPWDEASPQPPSSVHVTYEFLSMLWVQTVSANWHSWAWQTHMYVAPMLG